MRGFVIWAVIAALPGLARAQTPTPGATGDEPALAAARDRLDDARTRLEQLRRTLDQQRSDLAERLRAHHALVEQTEGQLAPLDQGTAPPGRADALLDQVLARRSAALSAGFDTARELLTGAPTPAAIPQLGEAVDALGDRSDVAALRHERSELVATADRLTGDARSLLDERADADRRIQAELTDLAARLLARASPARRAALRGPTRAALDAAGDDAMVIGYAIIYWAHKRWVDAADELTSPGGWWVLGRQLWSLTELALLLLLLRLAMRRWDRWMTGTIAAIGRSVHLGTGGLLAARLLELARGFGPALLVAGAAAAGYFLLGGAGAVPEVVVAHAVIFWIAILRAQLRLVEGVCRNADTRHAERTSEAHDLAELGESPPAAPPLPADVASFWALLARTWRLATRYATPVVVTLALVDLGTGHGVLYGALARIACWGIALVALAALLMWRPRIMHAVGGRESSSAFAHALERHSRRFYGVLVVLPAFLYVAARAVIRFVRTHLSNLDSTKRVLAWMFRRRVEKHAHEQGRIVVEPQELPAEIVGEFPDSPLAAEDRPTPRPCLDDIAATFSRWREDGSEGSIALVGPTGMGKSTILAMLEGKLDHPVRQVSIVNKITRRDQLVKRLAAMLELQGEPTTEGALVSLLHDGQKRVIAVDNGHNLFLRQVGGFDAWECFTRIVNETTDSVFWVVSFDDLAWQYLNNIAARISYFRKIIHLHGWNDTDLRRLILSRMRRTDYRPSFTDLVVSRLEGVSVSSQIIGTSHGYFRLLWDFTNGNPRDACHFWLRSLVPVPDQKRVRVLLFTAPTVEELERLPDDVAFVLQAIAEQENLTAQELTRVTNMSLEFCRFALRFCREAGYLHRDAATGASRLSVHWRGTIIRYLRRQHLIYS